MKRFKLDSSIILLSLCFGLVSCDRAPSSSPPESTAIQPQKEESDRANSPENAQPSQPSKTEKLPSSASQGDRTQTSATQTPQTSNSPSPTQNSQPKSDPSPTPNATPTSTPKTETERVDRPAIQPEYDFKPEEEPSVPVGNFEFQLKQASLKKELVDRSNQKSYSTESAEKPSYYLFVELTLTNGSDRPAVDLFRYQLDCGDGKPIDNAADAAVAYRSNQNLNLFAEIPPGETGTVADGFLVPESCLNSDRMTLKVSSIGEGEGTIPIRLK